MAFLFIYTCILSAAFVFDILLFTNTTIYLLLRLHLIISGNNSWYLGFRFYSQYPGIPCKGHWKEKRRQLMCVYLARRLDAESLFLVVESRGFSLMCCDGRAVFESRVHIVG